MDIQHPTINAFHVPNGGSRSSKIINGKRVCLEGIKLKKMGAKAGVSDWIILEPRGKYHGACIELKSPTGRLSDSQSYFLERCSLSGYFISLERSLEGFIKTVNFYLSLI